MNNLTSISLFLKSSVALSFILFIYISHSSNLKMSGKKLISVEFEVYGRVQGVFFRKHTQQESQKLGLKGWCMNTEKGTVQGVVEGQESKVNNMKKWLQHVGSPSSKIEKAEFRNEKFINEYTFNSFSIKR